MEYKIIRNTEDKDSLELENLLNEGYGILVVSIIGKTAEYVLGKPKQITTNIHEVKEVE